MLFQLQEDKKGLKNLLSTQNSNESTRSGAELWGLVKESIVNQVSFIELNTSETRKNYNFLIFLCF